MPKNGIFQSLSKFNFPASTTLVIIDRNIYLVRDKMYKSYTIKEVQFIGDELRHIMRRRIMIAPIRSQMFL